MARSIFSQDIWKQGLSAAKFRQLLGRPSKSVISRLLSKLPKLKEINLRKISWSKHMPIY